MIKVAEFSTKTKETSFHGQAPFWYGLWRLYVSMIELARCVECHTESCWSKLFMFLAHLLSLWTVFPDVILGLIATWVILRFWGVTQVLRGLQLHLTLESFPYNSESSPRSEFYLDTWHKEEQSCCRSAAQQLGNTFQMGLRDLHWHELNWFSEAAWDTQCSVAADRDPWHPGQWCRTACICADTADLQQADWYIMLSCPRTSEVVFGGLRQ